MTLRTKPTVEDAISHAATIKGGTFVEYQPGNGTRYPCTIVHLDLPPVALQLLGFAEHEPAGVFLFAWHSRPGKSHVFRNEGFLHWTYVAEHLGCRQPDAMVLAELIAYYTGRTAESAEDRGS